MASTTAAVVPDEYRGTDKLILGIEFSGHLDVEFRACL